MVGENTTTEGLTFLAASAAEALASISGKSIIITTKDKILLIAPPPERPDTIDYDVFPELSIYSGHSEEDMLPSYHYDNLGDLLIVPIVIGGKFEGFLEMEQPSKALSMSGTLELMLCRLTSDIIGRRWAEEPK